MDIIIVFFRDILDGPLYIVLFILNTIFICSCIGYLGEQYLNNKKQKEKFEQSHVDISKVSDNSQTNTIIQNSVSTINAVNNQSNVSATNTINNQTFNSISVNNSNNSDADSMTEYL